jgi:adenine-specific DNA-methyltransferase
VVTFSPAQTVVYGDFTKQTITDSFRTIVGNPPYVKGRKGEKNLYIRFIEQCYDYLDPDHGEMIFIVPSDFIKLTSAADIISKMSQTGSFTDFLFPHDETLFNDANIDVVAFRYEKGLLSNKAIVNGQEMICNVTNGICTFSNGEITGNPVSDMFDVFVGMVSGKDEVYRTAIGNIDLLTDEGKTERFIFTDKFPSGDTRIDAHLQENRGALLQRKIKAFGEKNWYEWGAPRNLTSIKKFWGRNCIYVKTMTRRKTVAFRGTVQYFGGTLLCLIPKKEESIEKIFDYFNSEEFQKDYMYAGRFKIGHKQISNAIIPH